MTTKAILITGGAGYIGSHVARQLGEAGERLVILDNLSTGFASAVLHGELVVGDVGNQALVAKIMREHNVDTVIHFAAHIYVPESIANPLKYYSNNTRGSLALLQCCQDAGIKNFIFSSTAAVYGIPDGGLAAETSPTSPINPYGTSKLMTEWMLRDLCSTADMRHVTLRYFNVAGSDPAGRIGQSTPRCTLLIKVASEAAVGKRSSLAIYGADYPTADGTGVRDYIHVEDLATAHVQALHYLRANGPSITLNCGYGHGYSVREVLRAIERMNGAPLPIREEQRRHGDPPVLIAKADRIREVLGWSPRFDDLDFIVSTQLNWEKKLLENPALASSSG